MAEYEMKKENSFRTILKSETKDERLDNDISNCSRIDFQNNLHTDNSFSSNFTSQLKRIIQRNAHHLNSGELASNLGSAPFTNAEAHHIIPIELVNRAFPPRLRKDDNDYYDYDTGWNGIYLKSTSPVRNDTSLPYHRQRNTLNHEDYTSFVEDGIDDIINLRDSENAEDIVENLRNGIGRMDNFTSLDDIGDPDYDEEEEDSYEEEEG